MICRGIKRTRIFCVFFLAEGEEEMFKIIKLRAENFVLYENLEIDFTSLPGNIVFINGVNHDVSGSGSNGSGKSLIGDLISDLLFDKTIRPHSAGSLVGPFKKWSFSSMRLFNSISKEVLCIAKWRNHPSHGNSVFFEKKSEEGKLFDLSRKKRKETYDAIWNELGITWRVFKNRNYFGQDDEDRFLRVTDSRKAEIIVEAQNLFDLQFAKKLAGEKKKETIRDLDSQKVKLEKIRFEISSLEAFLSEYEAKAREAEERETSLLENNLKEQEKAKKMILVWEKSSAGMDSLRRKLKGLKEEIFEAEKVRAERVSLESRVSVEVRNLESEILNRDELGSKISGLKIEANELKSQVITICSKCGAKLNKKRSFVTIKGIRRNIDLFLKEKRIAEKRIVKAENDLPGLKSRLGVLLEKEERLLPSLKKREIFLKELRVKEKCFSQAEVARAKLASLKVSAKEMRKRILFAKENPASEKLLLKKKNAEDLLIEEERKLVDLSLFREKAEFSWFVYDKTIRLLFNRFLSNLNYFSNIFLGILSDNDISVVFNPKIERKSKKVAEEISVLVSVAGEKPRDFRTYSGGEKRRIELSTQLALFSADDSTFPFLFLDEPFHGVHSEGRARILDLLESKAAEGNLIFVTNSEVLADGGWPTLMVERKGGRSVVK